MRYLVVYGLGGTLTLNCFVPFLQKEAVEGIAALLIVVFWYSLAVFLLPVLSCDHLNVLTRGVIGAVVLTGIVGILLPFLVSRPLSDFGRVWHLPVLPTALTLCFQVFNNRLRLAE